MYNQYLEEEKKMLITKIEKKNIASEEKKKPQSNIKLSLSHYIE